MRNYVYAVAIAAVIATSACTPTAPAHSGGHVTATHAAPAAAPHSSDVLWDTYVTGPALTDAGGGYLACRKSDHLLKQVPAVGFECNGGTHLKPDWYKPTVMSAEQMTEAWLGRDFALVGVGPVFTRMGEVGSGVVLYARARPAQSAVSAELSSACGGRGDAVSLSGRNASRLCLDVAVKWFNASSRTITINGQQILAEDQIGSACSVSADTKVEIKACQAST